MLIKDLLMKEGGDLKAKDSMGRTALHFACCSWSVESVCLVLNMTPDIIHLGDNVGRTPLHYSIWNSSDEQVNIIRTLLERNADVNQADDYGMTAMHHAAKGGRARAIPILIQRGADLGIKDPKYHKTPAEMSKTDRIRELITVYSAAPHVVRQKDRIYLDSAIKGKPVSVKKMTIFNEDEYKINNSQLQISQVEPPIRMGRSMVPDFLREVMHGIMSNLQEIGIKSGQHVKRPYLFTGSWLEGITNIEQLYDRIKGVTPNEAMLRVFNVLVPYDGNTPKISGQELAVSNFYGEYFDFELHSHSKEDNSKLGNSILKDTEFAKVYSENESLREQIKILEQQKRRLLESEKEYQTMIAGLKFDKNESSEKLRGYDALLQEKLGFEKKLADSEKVKQDFQRDLDLCQDKIRGQDHTIKEIQILLEKEIRKNEAIKKAEEDYLNKIKGLNAELELVKGMKSKPIVALKKKKYISRTMTEEEEATIRKMLVYVRENPPDVASRLRLEDKDADGSIGRYEFMQAMEKMERDNIDSYILSKIAGFDHDVPLVNVEDFMTYVRVFMENNEKQEITIMKKFMKAFSEKEQTVQEAFAEFDIDQDDSLSLEELKHLINELGIGITDEQIKHLYKQLDGDLNDEISIQEFQAKLLAYEKYKESTAIKKPVLNKIDKPDKKKAQTEEITAKQKILKKANAIGKAFMFKSKEGFDDISLQDNAASLLFGALGNPKFDKIKMEFNPIVGELKVQFQKFKDFSKSVQGIKKALLLVRLPGVTKTWLEKEVFIHGISSFKFAMRITIMNMLEENVGEEVKVVLASILEDGSHSTIGENQLSWKKCLAVPNNWAVNQKLEILKSEDKTLLTECRIQMKWITAENEEFKAKIFDDYYLKPTFKSPDKFSGFVEVVVSSAVLNEIQDSQKITCKLITPDNRSKTMSTTVFNGCQYQFNQKILAKLEKSKGEEVDSIHIQVMNNKDIIGESFINWEECLKFSRDYSPNKAFLLYKDGLRTLHKVYIKFRFFTEAQAALMKSANQEVSKADNSYLQGILKLGIVRARGLVGDEKNGDTLTSDPFVTVTVKDLVKLHKYSTDDVAKTLEPKWNEFVSIPLKLLKEGSAPVLEVTVFDYDMISANDLLGSCKVDLKPCLDKPCEWSINSFQKLTPTPQNKDKNAGEVYLMSYFVPKGTFDPNLSAFDIETKEEIKWKVGAGLLHFRVICAKSIAFMKNNIPQPEIDSYLDVKFPNGNSKESIKVKRLLDPVWNFKYSCKLPADEESGKKLSKSVTVNVMAKTGLLSSSKAGSVTINLQPCFDKLGSWAINQLFPIPGTEQELTLNNLKDLGKLYIQAKVVEKGMVDDEQEPEMVVDIPDPKAGEVRGTLMVHLIHCKDLPTIESGLFSGKDVPDPFVKFSTAGSDSQESSVIWDNANPIWNKKILMFYKLDNIENIKPLLIQVYDKDKISFANLMGSTSIDLTSCIKNPSKWMVDKILDLTMEKAYSKSGRQSQIYLQLKFLKEGEIDDGENPKLLEDLSRTIGDLKREGELTVKIIHAKGLIKADGDSSDPYAIITLPNGKKAQTEVCKKTVLPSWNFEHREKMLINDYRTIKPSLLEVYDKDGLLNADDLLGTCEIDLQPVIEDYGEWKVNDIYELQGPLKLQKKLNIKNFGSVYVQAIFIRNGEQITKPAIIKEDIEEIRKNAIVKGVIQIRVIHAKDLMKADSGLFSGPTSSDPYVWITWPDGKHSSTETRKVTVTPVWNKAFEHPVILDEYNLPYLKIEVFDNDGKLNSDDLLGFTNLDTAELVKNTGKWVVNRNFKLEGAKEFIGKFNKFGEIYLQARFLKEGSVDDKSVPEVTENLDEVILANTYEGVLELRVIHATGLISTDSGMEGSTSDPYLQIVLPDKKEWSSKVLKNSLNPIWKETMLHNIKIISVDLEPLELRLKDKDNLSADDLLGLAKVEVVDCFKSPNQWKINELIEMQAPGWVPFEKGRKIELYIQGRFIPNGTLPDPTEPTLIRDLAKELASKRVEGNFVVRVVHAKNLKAVDPKNCKLFARLEFNQKTKDSEYVLNTRSPLFETCGVFSVSIESVELLSKFKASIFTKGLFKNVVGEAEIDLSECVSKPSQWVINRLYKLNSPKELADKFEGNLGELYVQARLLVEGNTDFDAHPEYIEKIEEIKKLNKIKGKFIVHLFHARGLINEDGSSVDPFVKLKFMGKSQQTSNYKSTDFEINKSFNWDVDYESIAEITELELTVFDHDTFSRNDELGHGTIDVQKAFESPNTYAINEIVKLIPKQSLVGKYRDFGAVYFQAKYLPDGAEDSQNFAEIKESYQEYISKFRVKGTLCFNVISGHGLLIGDSKTSDPLIEIKIASGKSIKTKHVPNSLDPKWNELVKLKIDLPKSEASFVDLICWDADTFSNDNLGSTKINISQALSTPNTWAINSVFELSPPDWEKEKNTGECGSVYIQVRYLPEGIDDDGKKADLIDLSNVLRKEEPETQEPQKQEPQKEDPKTIEPQKEEPKTQDPKKEEPQKFDGMHGKLKIVLKGARNVIDQDGWGKGDSDCYVIITLPDKQTKKSSIIKDNLNPNWNEEFIFDVKIDKKNLGECSLHIWDDDNLSSDDCGEVKVDLNILLAKPNSWAINDILPIIYKSKPQGLLYSQMKYIEEGKLDNGDIPEEKDYPK